MNALRTNSGRDRKAAKEGKLDRDLVFRPDSTNLRTRLIHPDVDLELRRTKKKQNWKTRHRPWTNFANQLLGYRTIKLDCFTKEGQLFMMTKRSNFIEQLPNKTWYQPRGRFFGFSTKLSKEKVVRGCDGARRCLKLRRISKHFVPLSRES